MSLDRRLAIDDVPLDHPCESRDGWKPYTVSLETASQLSALPSARSVRFASRNRHGEFSTPGGKWGTAGAAIIMLVSDVSPVTGEHEGFGQTWANMAAVKALFGSRQKPVTLRMTPAVDGPSFTTMVECTGGGDEEVTPACWRSTFLLERLDPFWRDDLPIVVTEASVGALRGGSAPIADPQFMAPGQGVATRVRIRDQITGQWIRYEGDVPVGQYVRIEPADETAFIVANPHAWAGGVEDLAGVETGPGGFELQPAVDWTSTVEGVRLNARRAYL
ncbi:hypothetical protein EK0264_03770 [Epidermidibacterium keratini]|uniref:Phage tail family protein n=1 Tax=Epidermidibacterium keratini TaxID=1891644 RepID=A0A7L4YKY0_9ACTN|nr:hypothetical protein [Epidermidibacterium keratini]QHB99488.1 hypothetical protein EK0264_03770 [Epidermidibacterium keratini]